MDVVLTDLAMPGSMDGLGFAQVARTWRPGLPVVLTTGHLDPLRGVGRLPEGIGFVQKPHRRRQVAVALLGRTGAAGAAAVPVATA